MDDRSTDASAKIVLALFGLRIGRYVKRIARVELVVLKKFVGRSVKTVASRFGDDADQATRCASALRGVVVGLHCHFFNCIDGRFHTDGSDNAFIVVCAVDLLVVQFHVLSIDRKSAGLAPIIGALTAAQ